MNNSFKQGDIQQQRLWLPSESETQLAEGMASFTDDSKAWVSTITCFVFGSALTEALGSMLITA